MSEPVTRTILGSEVCIRSCPLTVTVTIMSYRSYKNLLSKAPLRTVTGTGNDPRYITQPLHTALLEGRALLQGFFEVSKKVQKRV